MEKYGRARFKGAYSKKQQQQQTIILSEPRNVKKKIMKQNHKKIKAQNHLKSEQGLP